MAIQYKIDVLPALKTAGYSTHRIRTEKIIGERTMQQIREGQLVSWSAMNKICRMLNCQPGDLLEYVDDVAEGRQQEDGGQ